ncbi:MAG: gamma-glutamyltransferase, partial [Chloroflexi bacterium]|nr:gamma-glutamyltransferase [Chloroflexota bacterium]
IDAAVAVAATLNVVEPYMSGMAGVGVALICIAGENRTRVLNFSGHAPAAATPEIYDKVNVEIGPLAPLVPGNIGGWMTMHREYGRLERSHLFKRAIEYAAEGVALTPFNAVALQTQLEKIDAFPSSTAALEFDRSNISAGAILRQPLLAESLAAVADGGPQEFYEGPLGDRLIEGLRSAGGIMTREELAEYRPRWQEPLTSKYRGLEVRVPPPNSGGFQIAETLNILDQHDLADYGSSETLHTLIETVFRAADDRAQYGGDPAEVEVPLVRLLSDAYAREVAASLDPAKSAGPAERWSRSRVDRPPVDFTKPYVPGMTTHFATADADGNVVTITQTLGEAFGSGLAPEGTGLFLNNMSKWFDIDPALGSPNLIGSGKEVDFCVAPVQLFDVSGDSARIRLSIGTPGSYGILHTSAQMIHHFVDAGMNIQEAIEAPRFRFYDDGTLLLEDRFPQSILNDLAAKGHDFRLLPAFHNAVGGGQGIEFTPHGTMLGGADPRRDGVAMGF